MSCHFGKCGACGENFARASAKFCSRCGAPKNGPPPESTAVVSQQSQPPARRTCAPSHTAAVLNNEHRDVTEKGRGIREEMNQLNDDFFGKPQPTMETGPRPDNQRTQQRLVEATTPSATGNPFDKYSATFYSLKPQYSKGPIDPAGSVFDASDRNLLCMDVRGNQLVVGSADHGLVVFDAVKGTKVRTLYAKNYGHSEWVTACQYLSDGRILSGGMDSKLCLWSSSAVRCDDLMGHSGSISQISTNQSDYAISAAYDRTLRVWDCRPGRGSGRCLATLSGHKQPVMSFAWGHSTLVSGDRKGSMMVWDVERSQAVTELATKGGQIGSVGMFADNENNLVMAGDQSGTVSVWDFRQAGATPIFQSCMHPGGVVSSLKATSMQATNYLISAGADKRMLVMDPRMGFEPVHTIAEHKDFIYSMETAANLVFSGGGNGWLLVHDVLTGKCQYGLGANTAAVRCIGVGADMLVCAGDDGKAVAYRY